MHDDAARTKRHAGRADLSTQKVAARHPEPYGQRRHTPQAVARGSAEGRVHHRQVRARRGHTGWGGCGAPGGIRTPDQWLRKPLLYPAELRAQRTRILTANGAPRLPHADRMPQRPAPAFARARGGRWWRPADGGGLREAGRGSAATHPMRFTVRAPGSPRLCTDASCLRQSRAAPCCRLAGPAATLARWVTNATKRPPRYRRARAWASTGNCCAATVRSARCCCCGRLGGRCGWPPTGCRRCGRCSCSAPGSG